MTTNVTHATLPSGPKPPKTVVTHDERATANRNHSAEVMRLAPIGFAGLALVLLPGALLPLSRAALVGFRELLGIAIEIGVAGTLVLFLKRPRRAVMLCWLVALDGLLLLSFLLAIAPLIQYRIYAAILVSTVLAGVVSMTPTGWRPPPIRWER